jgi:hypothetical protein
MSDTQILFCVCVCVRERERDRGRGNECVTLMCLKNIQQYVLIAVFSALRTQAT